SGAIRPVTPDDTAALKAVIDANELFPSEMLDEMMAGYFNGEAGDDFWITYDDGGPVAVAYYAPERMTSGTWNLYLIAVHPDRQGQGHGAALLGHVERALAARGERVLLVETSGLPSFERTRAFYRKMRLRRRSPDPRLLPSGRRQGGLSKGASPLFLPDGERKCVRGPTIRGARRLARAGVLDSTLSTATKRNEVVARLSPAFAVKLV
ncbi:MAG: GNAT family N-acetyltransferase, partial [Pirellulales bacterium]|nr:GNAT family N-acetyltransferase [Pirellulales bacterium]